MSVLSDAPDSYPFRAVAEVIIRALFMNLKFNLLKKFLRNRSPTVDAELSIRIS